MSSILNKIEKFVEETDNNKSIHWKEHLINTNYENINLNYGFGAINKTSFLKSIIHHIFSRILYKKEIFNSKEYFLYKKNFDKINRQIDVDTIRHIFTFNLLKRYTNKINNACMIGDGKINFLTGFFEIYPNSKLFSVNLTEVLIHDYLILQKYYTLKPNFIYKYEGNTKHCLIDYSDGY